MIPFGSLDLNPLDGQKRFLSSTFLQIKSKHILEIYTGFCNKSDVKQQLFCNLASMSQLNNKTTGRGDF